MLLILALIVATATFLFWLLDKLKINASGRYVLITGCDTGFGNALAKSLDRKGCFVFATCLTAKGAAELNDSSSERLCAIVMDVSSSASIKEAYKEVHEKLPKGSGLWGLVNNAAVPVNPGYYDWFTREEFRRILDVNLLGPVEVTNMFLPLVKRVKGRVVNMSSGIAFTPLSSGGYEMSKCGIEAFSDCLRRQMQHYSISVHIIEPGYFLTPINNRKVVIDDKLEMVWNRMTKEQQDDYGRQCIEECKNRAGTAAEASDPRLYLVTDAIEHALFAKYPWKRYPVGGIVRFISRPLSCLPAFIGDFMKNALFPLPKPQCCK